MHYNLKFEREQEELRIRKIIFRKFPMFLYDAMLLHLVFTNNLIIYQPNKYMFSYILRYYRSKLFISELINRIVLRNR